MAAEAAGQVRAVRDDAAQLSKQREALGRFKELLHVAWPGSDAEAMVELSTRSGQESKNACLFRRNGAILFRPKRGY